MRQAIDQAVLIYSQALKERKETLWESTVQERQRIVHQVIGVQESWVTLRRRAHQLVVETEYAPQSVRTLAEQGQLERVVYFLAGPEIRDKWRGCHFG